MALTISYNGYGVVVNADADTNDTGGSGTGDWRELGGGTIGANPDVPYFTGGTPSGSQGSKYATKTGYSYVDGITPLNFTGVGGNAEDNIIYAWINIQSKGSLASLATNGLACMYGSATSASREWKIAGNDDDNGWNGGWKCFAIDPQITGGTVLNGTPVFTAVDTLGLWIDTDVSVRADSIFQSQIIAAKGLIFTGTPTENAWTELADWTTDLASRAFGGLERRGSTIFMKTGIQVGDGSATTVFKASGNNIECEESSYWNGSAWVTGMPSTVNTINTTAAASLDWQDVIISGFTDNKLVLDTSAGNASSVSGGSIKVMQTLTVKSTDAFDSVVFSDNDALSSGAASYDNCTFNKCGTWTVDATATSFSGNKFKAALGVTAVVVASLEDLENNDFTSPSTGHAVELTSLGAGSMNWNCSHIGYAASNGSTGNETIFVNVASGTLTINVLPGAVSPTIRTAGAEVTVSEAVPFVLSGVVSGSRLVVKAAAGGLLTAGDVMLGPILITTDPYNAPGQPKNQPFEITLASASGSPKYKRIDELGDTGAAGYSRTFQQELDE